MPKRHTPKITHPLAERHEALWLAVTALHKDVLALGAKKPTAPVSEIVRIQAESLLSDCAPFIRQRRERLPVAAGDLAGLAVQLGQALAGLDAFESQHTIWDDRFACRLWQVAGANLPVKRLKPPSAAMAMPRRDMADLRHKLAQRIDGRQRAAYEEGFAAGRAARQGMPDPADQHADFAPPAPEMAAQTYPRLRSLD